MLPLPYNSLLKEVSLGLIIKFSVTHTRMGALPYIPDVYPWP